MTTIERKTRKGVGRVLSLISVFIAPIVSIILVIVGIVLAFLGYNNVGSDGTTITPIQGLVDGGIALIVIAYLTFFIMFLAIGYLLISYNPIAVRKDSVLDNSVVQKIISRLVFILVVAIIIFFINLVFTLFFVFLSAGDVEFSFSAGGQRAFEAFANELLVYFYGILAVFVGFQLFMTAWILYVTVKLFNVGLYKPKGAK